jgi:DNA-directed RNA polymerase subunit RPC12/RpoP
MAAAATQARDEEVVAAIAVVFSKRDKVETQRRLAQAVTAELARRKPGARVGGARARQLAIRSGIARVEMRLKEADGIDKVAACPVCGSKVRRVRNRTLSGGSVLTGLRCSECGWKSGRKLQLPSKYVFHRR